MGSYRVLTFGLDFFLLSTMVTLCLSGYSFLLQSDIILYESTINCHSLADKWFGYFQFCDYKWSHWRDLCASFWVNTCFPLSLIDTYVLGIKLSGIALAWHMKGSGFFFSSTAKNARKITCIMTSYQTWGVVQMIVLV
jgi:hypothetical protein